MRNVCYTSMIQIDTGARKFVRVSFFRNFSEFLFLSSPDFTLEEILEEDFVCLELTTDSRHRVSYSTLNTRSSRDVSGVARTRSQVSRLKFTQHSRGRAKLSEGADETFAPRDTTSCNGAPRSKVCIHYGIPKCPFK